MIILYGPLGNHDRDKQQSLIDGKLVCAYREYASIFGSIVYLCEQDNIVQPWEHSLATEDAVLNYCRSRPDDIVLSIKHNEPKDGLLRKIRNPKLYHACSAWNTVNPNCDISLVDTEERIVNASCRILYKGRDENIWKPTGAEKEFDYLLIGRAGNKGQMKFLEKLRSLKERRTVLWIGGSRYKKKASKIPGKRHHIKFTDMLGPAEVSNLISKGKVGILFTEFDGEGFPETFMELTLCGVPVVYSNIGPYNKKYFHAHNSVITDEKGLLSAAENLRKSHNPELCRKEAVENYTLKSSYEYMVSLINGNSGNYR